MLALCFIRKCIRLENARIMLYGQCSVERFLDRFLGFDLPESVILAFSPEFLTKVNVLLKALFLNAFLSTNYHLGAVY